MAVTLHLMTLFHEKFYFRADREYNSEDCRRMQENILTDKAASTLEVDESTVRSVWKYEFNLYREATERDVKRDRKIEGK